MIRAMKDSGIEWIGKIPQDWNLTKIKYCCSIYTGNSISDDEKDNYTNEENAISYVATKDIDVDTNAINYDNGLYVPIDNSDFKVAPKDSILLCVEGGSAGKKIAYTNRDICFVNKLCCFNAESDYSSKYIFYSLQCSSFLTEFNLSMSGLIGGVSTKQLKNIFLSFSSYKEQQAIADYLDKKCGEIDKVVETEKAVIEKLKEYKQSVITEAVTKGLDKSVPLKDSGLEWGGQIPVAWQQIKLSELCDRPITYGIVKLGDEDPNGVKVLRCSDVQAGFIIDKNIRTVSEKLSQEYKRTILRGGEVVVNVRGTLGGCAIVPRYLSGCNISREIAMVSVIDADNRFVMYYLLSHMFKSYQDYYIRGALYKGLNINLLAKCPIFLPNHTEQKQIVDYLDKKCSEIDQAIAYKEQVIEKFTEYKKSLIYECVTGKKEVA